MRRRCRGRWAVQNRTEHVLGGPGAMWRRPHCPAAHASHSRRSPSHARSLAVADRHAPHARSTHSSTHARSAHARSARLPSLTLTPVTLAPLSRTPLSLTPLTLPPCPPAAGTFASRRSTSPSTGTSGRRCRSAHKALPRPLRRGVGPRVGVRCALASPPGASQGEARSAAL